MDTPTEGTAAKILLAAVACIERDGLPGLTVRDIAKEAEVNVAAVNYHFGSKDILLRKVLQDRLGHFKQDIAELLNQEEKPSSERLFDALAYILNGALDWPRMMQAIMNTSLTDRSVSSAFNRSLAEIIEKVSAVLCPAEPRSAVAKAAHLVSAVIFPGMAPGLFTKLPELDLSKAERRGDFVRALIDGIRA
jgi:TetR/AcrR family transcriptional regulator, regulator of cefoperazone and chloramphenicol sensitivity